MAEPIKNAILTPHAISEMQRRGIGIEIVRRILESPEQRRVVRAGRDVLQSSVNMAETTYLIRVFVDIDRPTPEVVTVYRTSKVDKYWSADP